MADVKEYEACNKEQQAGWAAGQSEFIHGDLPGDDVDEFMAAFRAKYAGSSQDFLDGALWGVLGEQ